MHRKRRFIIIRGSCVSNTPPPVDPTYDDTLSANHPRQIPRQSQGNDNGGPSAIRAAGRYPGVPLPIVIMVILAMRLRSTYESRGDQCDEVG